MDLKQFFEVFKEDINNIYDEIGLSKKVRNNINEALTECFGIINLPLAPNDLYDIISTLAVGSYEIVKNKSISIRKSEFIKKIDSEMLFYVDEDVYQEYIENRKNNK